MHRPTYTHLARLPWKALAQTILLGAVAASVAQVQPGLAISPIGAAETLRTPTASGIASDLAFDDAAMRTSLSNLSSGTHVRVKNVGTKASSAAVVACTKTTDTLMFDGNKQRNSSNFNVSIPSLPPNGQFAQSPEIFGAWENVSLDCTLDAANVSGEANKANNKFSWRRQTALSAAAASPVTASAGTTNANAVRARAELAFDETAMTQAIQRLPVIVKNIGGTTSSPTQIGCDTTTQAHIDRQNDVIRNGGVPIGTGVYAANIPALAPGATHTVYTSATNVTDVRQHRCNGVRFPDANNLGSGTIGFLWNWQNLNVGRPIASPVVSAIPSAQIIGNSDLAFVTQSMDNDLPPSAAQVAYRIHIRNIGAGRSRATEVRCEDVGEAADTTPGPAMGQMKPWRRAWTRTVPAINAGQSYSDVAEVLGHERVFKRSCTIDPQRLSGENNTTNNTYERTINAALRAPVRSDLPSAAFAPKK
jgi:hypothetical protein